MFKEPKMKYKLKFLFSPFLIGLPVFSAMAMQQENPSNSNNESSKAVTPYEEKEKDVADTRSNSVAELLASRQFNKTRKPIDPRKIVTRMLSENNPPSLDEESQRDAHNSFQKSDE